MSAFAINFATGLLSAMAAGAVLVGVAIEWGKINARWRREAAERLARLNRLSIGDRP